MEVKALASVDEWPVHPVEYTNNKGEICTGLEVCRGRQGGVGLRYIVTEQGDSIVVPESNVRIITNNVRTRIIINILEK